MQRRSSSRLVKSDIPPPPPPKPFLASKSHAKDKSVSPKRALIRAPASSTGHQNEGGQRRPATRSRTVIEKSESIDSGTSSKDDAIKIVVDGNADQNHNWQTSPALLIDSILSEVFSYLSISELIICREVCTEWNNQIVPFMVRKNLGKVVLLKRGGLKDLREFTSLMESSQRDPFTKYRLYNIPTLHFAHPDVGKLLQLCGSNIKSLELKIPELLTMKTFVQCLTELVPNLESLQLEGLPVHTDATMDSSPYDSASGNGLRGTFPKLINISIDRNCSSDLMEAWNTLFLATPNLQQINMKECSVSMLEGLKASKRIKTVNQLRFSCLNQENITFLETAGVNKEILLKKLSVMEICRRSDTASMEKCLTAQGKNLIELDIGYKRNLELYYGGPGPCCLMKLQKMTSLTKITMGMSGNNVLFKCTNPLEDLPNLKLVKIRNINRNRAYIMSESFCSPTVKDLFVNFHDTPGSCCGQVFAQHPEVVGFLQKMFPNVERLTWTFPSLILIKNLVRAWPNLKYLNLKLNMESKEFVFTRESLTTLTTLNGMKKLFSISKLKRLETLVVNRQFFNISAVKSDTDMDDSRIG